VLGSITADKTLLTASASMLIAAPGVMPVDRPQV
jgi:hypothetical protein